MAKQYKTGLIITGDASGGIRAIKATDNELGKLNQGFEQGSRRSRQFNQDVNATSQGLTILKRAAAPIAGAIAGMFAANTLQNQIDWGDQLQKTNLRIGASTEALSQYSYVAKLSGVEFGQLTTAWQRQTRRIAEAAAGTGVASKALDRLGLSAKDLNQLAPEEQFERIATAMQNVESSSERVALAQKLWDSEGVKLVQIVNQGTDAIAAMRAEADALGLTISQDTANAMATYNDEVDRLKFAAQGLSQTIAGELVPSMTAGLQTTSAFIQQVGGADAILETAADAATMFAVVMGGRLAGALTKSTQGMISDAAAAVAQAKAHATATAAARTKAAETLRVAQADQAAASRALANGHAIAAATGNTTLRTKAITQMAAANQRAIAAEAAHTAAVNANSAAMARGTVAAQGMAAATRTGASALALIGGPAGAALIAGAGLYYFREELGLTDDKMQGTIGTIESLGDSFISEFGSMGAELVGGFRGMRGELIEIDASFIDLKASAVESFAGIVGSSADVINLGLIPIQYALNALDQGFANWINRAASAFESAGAMPFGMTNLFGEQVARLRSMADDLAAGMIEPIGISTAALETNAQSWRNQADAMRATADEVRGNVTPATDDLVVTFQTLDQWLDEIERGAGRAGSSLRDNAPDAQTIAAWEKYNDQLRDSLAASRDPSAVGAANRELDSMGVTDPIRRAITVGLALQEDQVERQKELQKEAANAARQAASEAERAYQQQARAAEQSAKQQANALRSLQHEMDPLLAEHATYIERIGVLDQALSDNTITQDEYGESMRWAAEQYQRAATGAEEYEKQTETLASTYDRHNQKAKQLQTALEQINQRYRAGEIDGEQYGRMIGGIREEMQQLALESDPAAQEMARAWEEASNRIDETFADAFTGAFDSFDDFTDQLLDGFKRLLGELAYQATLKPIVVQFTQQMGGALGMPSVGGQAGGGFNLGSIGSLKNGWNAVSGLFGGGAASTAAGYTGALGSATSTGYGGALGSAVSGAASAGGGFMGAASAAMPWLAGGLLADNVLGLGITEGITKAISGLFGGGDTPFYGAVGSGSGIKAYRTETALGETGFTERQRIEKATSEGTQEWAANLFEASKNLDAVIASTARSNDELDAMKVAVNGFSVASGNASRLVKAQLIDRTLVALEAAGHDVSSAWGGLDAEQLAARIEVASGAMSVMSASSERLNLQFDVTSSSALRAAGNIAQYAGGVQNLASLQDQYFQRYFSDTERAAALQADLTASLNAMGLALPQNEAGFRALVEAQDQNTDAGGRNYVQLLQLSRGFTQLQDMLGQAETVVRDFAAELSAARDAVSSAEEQVRRAFQAFDKQAFDQQIKLMEMAGDSAGALALQRERELLSIDPLLHETQRFIWAMEDETSAKQSATQASIESAKAAQRYISEMSQFAGTLGTISAWVDQQKATGSSPGTNLGEAQAQFARQLVMAENGDRDALQSITQYADRVLQANEAYNASGAAGQRIRDDVMGALEGLPDAISDAEFIVNGFRDAISNELATEIERAIFSSRYKIDTLIEFAADASGLPADLRTILGEQAHRLDSTINYLLGDNQLDNELRQLALLATNNLVSTVDYITGSTLSTSDKMLALSSSNTMTSVIDFVLGSDLDRASRILALESSNRYTSMIDMILGRNLKPDDRRLALDSSNRYASLIDYVVRSELTGGNRRLALSSLNEYDALIDFATRKNVSSDDRKLALDNGNRYLSTMDYIVGSKIDSGSRTMALNSSNRYLSTINFLLGRDITGDDRTLALDTANRFDASIRYILDSPLTGGDRRLALSSGQTFDALVQYYSDDTLTDAERRMALESANRYVSTMDYVMGRDIDDGSRAMALGSTNRYLSTVNIVMGSNIGKADRTLALESANRFDAVVRYVVDSPISGGDRRLALSAGQHYEALIGYYVDKDVSRADRTLALNSGNDYLAMIDLVLGKNLSADNRRLALSSNNRFVSIVDTVVGKKITGSDRRLALNSTNLYTTVVDAVFARGISADVRTLALSNTNAIMATIDGVLARNMDGDVKTLALKKSNTFLTTLKTAMADGRLSADERRVLDAKSDSIVKTLRTGGNLNLSKDEWAVINAANGSKRLQLLADVAFGRSDLDQLENIDDNTKPLAEQARDQLKELTGMVGEMSRTTDQFVGLNSNIVSLRDSINALGVAQAEVARIERERKAAEQAERDRVQKERQITSQASDVKSHIARFDDLLTNQGWNKYVNQDRADQLQNFGWISGDIGQFEKNIENWSKSQKFTAYAGRYQAFKESREGQLASLRKDYLALTGNAAPFYDGGYTGPGGKNDPAGIVHAGEFVVRKEMVEQPGVRGMLESLNRNGLSKPAAMPLPSFPLLNRNDQADVVRDLLNENRKLRQELNARLDKIEKHSAAAVAVQQAGFNGQINEQKKSNAALDDMSAAARLEASR
ncbi:hypothetical protein FF32_15640 [Halomonas campaniensis]|nr:hypothetical protein FF32_15640 [Halomonas campaniensis]